MTNDWQTVLLEKCLSERKEFVTIDDLTRYKRARNQWYGKGIVLRDEIYGSEIKTKQQQIVRKSEFVVAEIDAKEGSFGVVPPELDGAIVSSHYFVFQINEAVCMPSWLDLLSRANLFQDQVKAQGSTNYSAVRPSQILAFEISLPPLAAQRRIVACVDALALRVEEARGLRRAAVEEAEAVMKVEIHGVMEEGGWRDTPLCEVLDRCEGGTWGFADDDNGVAILRPNNISGQGNLVLHDVKIRSVSMREVEKCRLQNGDVILTKSNSKELVGNSALFEQPSDPRIFVPSNFLQSLRFKSAVVLPKFAWYILWSPRSRSYFQMNCSGTSPSLQNLSGSKLKALPFPIPPLTEQHHIVAYLDGLQTKVDELRSLQAETQKELDALMPSILAKAFAGEL